MKIVRGGKFSRLQHLVEIHWKTFTVATAIANPRKLWKFSNVNDLHYTV